MKRLILIIVIIISLNVYATEEGRRIVRLKYNGGGDWYNDPDIIPNFAKFINKNFQLNFNMREKVLSLESDEIFYYPFLFLTGHGNIKFNDKEIENLRLYLESGGFLYADDDFGMDEYFRREIKKVFPDKNLIELPDNFELMSYIYKFDKLPKIHEHYKGPPKFYGIFINNRLCVLYTYNTNISDGWASEDVHNDPFPVRLQALKMGVNILFYALTH